MSSGAQAQAGPVRSQSEPRVLFVNPRKGDILARSVRQGRIPRPKRKKNEPIRGRRGRPLTSASPIPLNPPHFPFTIPSKPLLPKDLPVDKPPELPDTPYSI